MKLLRNAAVLLALLCLPAAGLLAQRNVFFFPGPPRLPDATPTTCLYRIPADSVENIVFRNTNVDPGTSWMQRPSYRAPRGREDSLLNSPVEPGYYLCVRAERNRVLAWIRRKSAFDAQLLNLDEVQLLSLKDGRGRPDTTAVVLQGRRRIHYDAKMDAYVLRDLVNGDTLRITEGDDLDLYRIFVQPNSGYVPPRAQNLAAQAAAARQEFNGYLVTNKPKYLPGDTVKWKAYLQLPNERSDLVKEPLTLSLAQVYNRYERYSYGYSNYSGRTYAISRSFKADTPGVYFGEFVLGDSVEIDNNYDLVVTGNSSGLRLSQRLRVEDYLLSQTNLRVTGEGWQFYQKGDSVLLYASGNDANGLPVLDGTLSISVRPVSYNSQPDSFYFLPDTLYKASMAVSPEGENSLSFSTAPFSDDLMEMQVSVSLVNSNFERRDTVFNLRYGAYRLIMKSTVKDRDAVIEVFRNKKSVKAEGFATRYTGSWDTLRVTYPYRLRLRNEDQIVRFFLQDSSGAVIASTEVTIPQLSVSGIAEFNNDTAYLRLQNPGGLLYRYRAYQADKFLGYGASRGDTTFAIYSPKGETVTVEGFYTSRGQMLPARFEIQRLDRNLHIALRKKDIVFPGQTDTISLSLRNDKSEAVGNTNVTVLAFNSQFTEDNVPELPYAGNVFPAHTSGKFSRGINHFGTRYAVPARPDRRWLSRCGADTMFFYKNLYLLPDKVAWLHFPIADSNTSQLAFYLKQGDEYLRPELILIDYQPVYYSKANSSYPDAIYVRPGTHQIQIRTRTDRFYLNNFEVCPGRKTVFFARVDSLGPFTWTKQVGVKKKRKQYRSYSWQDTILAPVISHAVVPEILEPDERNRLQSTLFMYRNETGSPAWLLQGRQSFFIAGNNYYLLPKYSELNGYSYGDYTTRFSLVGPLNMQDSAGFFQAGNLKLRFMPELNYVYSFRPGMQRMERQRVIDYLGESLPGGTTWPAIDTVNRQVVFYDSLRVHDEPAPSADYAEHPLPVEQLRLPSLFSYQSKPWPDSASDAQLILSSKSRGGQPLRVLIRDSRGEAWLFRYPQYGTLQLPAGTYSFQAIWPGDSISRIPALQLRRGGKNLLPLWKQNLSLFNYKNPPAEWRPFLHQLPVDRLAWRGLVHYIQRSPAGHYGAIQGRLGGQSGEDSRLRVELRRVGKRQLLAQVVRDNSTYEFDSLEAGRYQLRFVHAGGGVVTATVLVKTDSILVLSVMALESWRIVENSIGQQFYAMSGSDKAGISGTVLNEAGRKLINWPVSIYQYGREVGIVRTDEDGDFLVKPLSPGTYGLRVEHGGATRSVDGIQVGEAEVLTVRLSFQAGAERTLNSTVVVNARRMKRRTTLPSSGISNISAEQMASSGEADLGMYIQAAPPMPSYRSYSGSNSSLSLSSGAGRLNGNTYVVDGVIRQRSGAQPSNEAFYDASAIGLFRGNTYEAYVANSDAELEERDSLGNLPRRYLREAEARQAFINNFLSNAMAGSGLRRNFRDWAIWEPDLWTDEKGEVHFNVSYPDNLTSWKTYVLAMNRDGYSGKVMEITKAYKPLSASLSAPRFLRYGDTAVVIGKVANYTGQPFQLREGFLQDGRELSSDTMTVNNSRVSTVNVIAPGSDSIGTLELPLTYSIRAESGFTDGEERSLPVYPVGTVQSTGDLFVLEGDTTVSSRPDSSLRFFTGRAHLYVEGGALDVMLREIQKLKEYPYGCMEQLTTKLLAISYEEEVKRLLGNRNFNNSKTKRKILEQLVAAQRRDGGFAWFREGPVDYRITNYILSTMQRANNDHWLDVVLSRGYQHLSSHLGEMDVQDQISALSTLSAAGWQTAAYRPLLEKLDSLELGLYDRMTLLRIRKEQKLSYASRLDSLLQSATEDRTGLYWSFGSYDWYRDDLATNLMALRLVRNDSVYGHLAEKIIRHVLLQRQPDGYYRSTASSGLVLSTILPDLLRGGADTARLRKGVPSFVRVSGTVRDTIRSFPRRYDVRNPKPSFTVRKTGISPVFATVVYEYYNPHPQPHDSNFSVRSYLLNKNGDTASSLKQGEKATVRAIVRVRRAGDYVMINVPIPAGCVQTDKDKTGRQQFETSREAFKDQTAIFCRQLTPGVYTFDVSVEARYKGSYSVNPARAGLMYYPEEYGNAEVKRVVIR